MAKKAPSMKELFPFTEEGFEEALKAREILWWEYKDAYKELQQRLPELNLGSEFRTLREKCEQPISRIKKMEKHIDLIRRTLNKEPVPSIIE